MITCERLKIERKSLILCVCVGVGQRVSVFTDYKMTYGSLSAPCLSLFFSCVCKCDPEMERERERESDR